MRVEPVPSARWVNANVVASAQAHGDHVAGTGQVRVWGGHAAVAGRPTRPEHAGSVGQPGLRVLNDRDTPSPTTDTSARPMVALPVSVTRPADRRGGGVAQLLIEGERHTVTATSVAASAGEQAAYLHGPSIGSVPASAALTVGPPRSTPAAG